MKLTDTVSHGSDVYLECLYEQLEAREHLDGARLFWHQGMVHCAIGVIPRG